MSIIDSIYETTQAFSIHVKDADKVLLLRCGEVDAVSHIEKVGEMYNENTDCKIFTSHLFNLQSAGKGLSIKAILCFEFLDKHVFILNTIAMKHITKGEEHTFIPKELMGELKGGLYETERDILSFES